MTVFEHMELSYIAWGNAISVISLGIAILSGYVVVAYTVGSKLSFRQVTVLNMAYILWCSFLCLSTYQIALGAQANALKAKAIKPDAAPFVNYYADETIVFLYVILVGASLWFMWDVRHQKLGNS